LGQSPVDYLRRHRIGLAKELLIRTSLSVKDIAEQVGYAEQSQFSRTFRKSESVSPLAYRQSWQRSELWS
jgi:transcriptional regulator GlxA family with amidase domain